MAAISERRCPWKDKGGGLAHTPFSGVCDVPKRQAGLEILLP